MRQLCGIICLLLFISHLVYELVDVKFDNGVEAVITIGLTIVGIYVSWFAITAVTKK